MFFNVMKARVIDRNTPIWARKHNIYKPMIMAHMGFVAQIVARDSRGESILVAR